MKRAGLSEPVDVDADVKVEPRTSSSTAVGDNDEEYIDVDALEVFLMLLFPKSWLTLISHSYYSRKKSRCKVIGQRDSGRHAQLRGLLPSRANTHQSIWKGKAPYLNRWMERLLI